MRKKEDWSFSVDYSKNWRDWGLREYAVLGGAALLLKSILLPTRIGGLKLMPVRHGVEGVQENRERHFEINKDALLSQFYKEPPEEQKKMEHALDVFLLALKGKKSSQEAGEDARHAYRKVGGKSPKVKEAILRLSLIDEAMDS